ncbi:PEP-CTERM sorting domain-containing protein [Roseisolibacter sp. H3M3-2]|uniref:PEP-CTERM sorting domain-containing protein n=1 Tax=Roseisolibacter sp. H3M3-2 TaxID=3031323 RepID=UPI0023DAA99E|nr:PEP-CTERM sorting domain-containing protein [Roseisolibacter sp. H3M3-2]MDF1502290.1 PEP-CTERM sorting domain-containing protein [Roseisolibacter sp. H3M3-2]
MPTLLSVNVRLELFGRAAVGPYAGADEFRGDLALAGMFNPIFLLNPGVYTFFASDVRHFGPDLGPGWSPDWLGITLLLPDPNDPTAILGGPGQAGLLLDRVGGGASVVPEPSTWLLLGTGLLAVGGVAARRRVT